MSAPLAFVGLDEQIACIKRELAMRQRVYGRWVESGKMTAPKRDKEFREMTAVLRTLEQLQSGERLL